MGRRWARGNGKNFSKKKLSPLDSGDARGTVRNKLNRLGEIYIDGAEQPIRRPKDDLEQKANYSGKKKRHTSKVVVICGQDKTVEAITPTYNGSSHDFAVFKTEHINELLPEKVPVYVDTGFEGIKKICPKHKIRKPKKKPRGRNLNGGEKNGNKLISRRRVRAEHAIGGMKKFKIFSAIYRGITPNQDKIAKVVAGLWNLQLIMRGHASAAGYSL